MAIMDKEKRKGRDNQPATAEGDETFSHKVATCLGRNILFFCLLVNQATNLGITHGTLADFLLQRHHSGMDAVKTFIHWQGVGG